MQSKRQSLIETVTSTFIGLAVSFLTQIIVFPMYNLEVNFNQNLYYCLVGEELEINL